MFSILVPVMIRYRLVISRHEDNTKTIYIIGITCALIPTTTPGVKIGRRHLPLNTVFHNGPTQGKDVFIPADWIIGGTEMAGHGWRMLEQEELPR